MTRGYLVAGSTARMSEVYPAAEECVGGWQQEHVNVVPLSGYDPGQFQFPQDVPLDPEYRMSGQGIDVVDDHDCPAEALVRYAWSDCRYGIRDHLLEVQLLPGGRASSRAQSRHDSLEQFKRVGD